MTRRPVVAVLAGALVLGGCGGGADPQPDRGAAQAAQAAQGRTYASAVSDVTERTRARLAEISGTADYDDGAAAARTTRDYAGAIGSAATDLGRADPPPPARGEHAALVALYTRTAARMGELADAFTAADGPRALALRAQELSGEVQQLSTQETQLRRSIERALAGASTPAQAR